MEILNQKTQKLTLMKMKLMYQIKERDDKLDKLKLVGNPQTMEEVDNRMSQIWLLESMLSSLLQWLKMSKDTQIMEIMVQVTKEKEKLAKIEKVVVKRRLISKF